jgi:hypothetical protein
MPRGFSAYDASSSGPGEKAADTEAAISAPPASHGTGRHRGESRRPSGKRATRKMPGTTMKYIHAQDWSHAPYSGAGTAPGFVSRP